MKMKLFTQTILAASLLSASFYAAANDVMCPSPELIKQSWQMLDTVSRMGSEKFTVWSLDAVRNGDYKWHITTYATANDLNTALVAGQNNVKNITSQKNKIAMGTEDVYLCGYDSATDEMGVTAISFKNENASFKFAAFNPKALS